MATGNMPIDFFPNDPLAGGNTFSIPGGRDPLGTEDPRNQGLLDTLTGKSSGSGFDIYGLINGLIGAYSGIRAAGAQNKAIALTQERLGEARKAASAENFASLVARLQPLFRELVASGLGPQFQQTLATQIAKSGLTGSGVGNALKGMGSAMPGIFALQQAFGEAGRIQEGQIGVELGFPMPSPKSDPFSEALVRGASAYFATVSGAREKEAMTPPAERELFPSLSPTNTSGRRY